MAQTRIKSPDGVKYRKESARQITPELAEKWLAKNDKNRNIRSNVVSLYAHDMKSGQWAYTAAPIVFGKSGKLLDGQHRLAAVIASGVTIECDVVYGVDDEAQKYMDTGARRSAGDMVALDGHVNGMMLAAIARIAIIFVERKKGEGSMVSVADIREWITKNSPEIEEIAQATARHRLNLYPIPPSVIGMCHWRFNQLDPEAAEQFMELWVSKVGWEEGDALQALDRRIRRADAARERVTKREYVSMIFRTWNAWRKGEKVTKLPASSRSGVVDIPELV